MGLKKRTKVSAAFSMSSLTDIIFLLLIFFMLTSSVVAPNALNLKLPGKSNPSVSSSTPPKDVAVSRSGSFRLDGNRISRGNLRKAMARIARGRSPKVTLSWEKGTPVEHMVYVMDLAMQYNVDAILIAPK